MSNENPYSPPNTVGSNAETSGVGKPRTRLLSCILLTALASVIASIPLAGLIGLVFRFPVPFAGYTSGPSAVLPAMIGAAIYGMIGGALVQAILGSVGGMVIYSAARKNPARSRWLILVGGTLSALPGLLLLAMLDWIIGPW